VEGVVVGANGQKLYLEHTGLSSVTTIDSIELKANGKFRFSEPAPKYPDFYRLRLKNNLIHLSVDTCETIEIVADAHTFSTSYTVEGSENCKALKEITLAQLDAAHEVHKLRESYGMKLIPDTTYQSSIVEAVSAYKDTVKKYIFGNPKSAAAYFALFQQIDGLWIYDLYDRTDSRAYGAVATSYKLYYPESPRTKQLETLALQSLRVIRGERLLQNNLADKAQEVGYIEIELPDVNGKKIKLSETAQGKAVLVNFTAFQTEWSSEFNITLNELYNKYKASGFEIYQVSLDRDEHFWKNVVVHLPWVSVHDPQSVYSSSAAAYNVRQLPALFLINRHGQLFKRIESVETLSNDVKEALK
jgi:peroxiredoxin